MSKGFSDVDWRKKPMQERSRFTVEAILDAAIQVFEQHGYAAGTTARIAERAGVSVGTLYQYFPNKDAILIALTAAHLSECRALAARMFQEIQRTTHTLEQAFQIVVAGFVELHMLNPQVHLLLFEEVVLPREVQQNLEAVLQAIAIEVQRLLEAHTVIPTSRLPLAAYVIVQVAEHLTHQLVLHPPHAMSNEAVVGEIVGVLLGYIEQLSQQT